MFVCDIRDIRDRRTICIIHRILFLALLFYTFLNILQKFENLVTSTFGHSCNTTRMCSCFLLFKFLSFATLFFIINVDLRNVTYILAYNNKSARKLKVSLKASRHLYDSNSKAAINGGVPETCT